MGAGAGAGRRPSGSKAAPRESRVVLEAKQARVPPAKQASGTARAEIARVPAVLVCPAPSRAPVLAPRQETCARGDTAQTPVEQSELCSSAASNSSSPRFPGVSPACAPAPDCGPIVSPGRTGSLSLGRRSKPDVIAAGRLGGCARPSGGSLGSLVRNSSGEPVARRLEAGRAEPVKRRMVAPARAW